MPSRERVQELISETESGRNVEAYRTFYTEDTVAQDNQGPECVGREANAIRQAASLASVAEVHENRAVFVLVDGDHAVINWVLDVTLKNGQRRQRDELAFQTWQGDKIARERFYYDSANTGGESV